MNVLHRYNVMKNLMKKLKCVGKFSVVLIKSTTNSGFRRFLCINEE